MKSQRLSYAYYDLYFMQQGPQTELLLTSAKLVDTFESDENVQED